MNKAALLILLAIFSHTLWAEEETMEQEDSPSWVVTLDAGGLLLFGPTINIGYQFQEDLEIFAGFRYVAAGLGYYAFSEARGFTPTWGGNFTTGLGAKYSFLEHFDGKANWVVGGTLEYFQVFVNAFEGEVYQEDEFATGAAISISAGYQFSLSNIHFLELSLGFLYAQPFLAKLYFHQTDDLEVVTIGEGTIPVQTPLFGLALGFRL